MQAFIAKLPEAFLLCPHTFTLGNHPKTIWFLVSKLVGKLRSCIFVLPDTIVFRLLAFMFPRKLYFKAFQFSWWLQCSCCARSGPKLQVLGIYIHASISSVRIRNTWAAGELSLCVFMRVWESLDTNSLYFFSQLLPTILGLAVPDKSYLLHYQHCYHVQMRKVDVIFWVRNSTPLSNVCENVFLRLFHSQLEETGVAWGDGF